MLFLSKALPALEFSFYGQSLIWSFLIVTIGPLGSNVEIQTRAVSYLKHEKISRLAYLCSKSLSATVIISCLFLFLIGVSYLLQYLSFERMMSATLGIALGVVQSFFLLKTTIIRCNFDFRKYAHLFAMRSFLIFICYLGAISFVQEYKFFVLIDIIITLLLIGPVKLPIPFGLKIKPVFKFSIFLHIYKNISLILFVVSSFILVSFERIVGYFLLDDSEYVVIAFAMVFFTASANIQSIANSYIFPVMAKCFDENGEVELVRQGLLYTLTSTFFLVLMVSIIATASASYLILFFENIPLTKSLIWLIFILSVLRIGDFFTNIFLLLNKEKTLICLRLFSFIGGLAYVHQSTVAADFIFAAVLCTLITFILAIGVLIFRLKLIKKRG